MDRRSFLTTAAAATAAASTAAAAAAEPQAQGAVAAPAVATEPVKDLVLATPWPLDLPGVGDAAMRLARRIETATGGRYRIHLEQHVEGSAEAILTGIADLAFASEHANLGHDRAFAYFAGLPGDAGLDPADFQAWLAVGGGQVLWDDLAARHGAKPLLAGHTGRSPGLWSRRPIESAADLAGVRVSVRGLGDETVRLLGAVPARLGAAELCAALAGGRVDAAEWAGPFASLALGLDTAARLSYDPGINAAGTSLTLAVRLGLWERMPAADRAILEGCAAEELRLSLAEATAHDPVARRHLAERRHVELRRFRWDVIEALAEAADAVVAGVAAESPLARRIDDSYRAFRALVTGLKQGRAATAA
jgi:TRAP-type mannitol/chloroaromatic compound transport system substrate-binding protein